VTKMGLAIGVKIARMVTGIEIGVRLGSGKLQSGLESKVSKEIVIDSGQKSGPRRSCTRGNVAREPHRRMKPRACETLFCLDS